LVAACLAAAGRHVSSWQAGAETSNEPGSLTGKVFAEFGLHRLKCGSLNGVRASLVSCYG
jgi:hypothetical protein